MMTKIKFKKRGGHLFHDSHLPTQDLETIDYMMQTEYEAQTEIDRVEQTINESANNIDQLVKELGTHYFS